MIRCFVALQLPDEVRHRGVQLIRRLAGPEWVKWVAPEQMHITLNFLGDIDLTQAGRYCKAVEEAAAEADAFELEFRGAGAFPHADRPRALWMGVVASDPLLRLQADLSQRLAQIGWSPEHRRYQPHVTLGRLRGGGHDELAQRLGENADFDGGTAWVDEVVVMSSTLTREGPIYEILGRAALGRDR